MKTRRDFLRGMGLGAAGLALPSTALGGGRRRHGGVCCECGRVDACERGQALKVQSTYVQKACPLHIVTGGGGVYYYYCVICPGGQFVTSPSSNPSLTPPPDPCTNLSICWPYTAAPVQAADHEEPGKYLGFVFNKSSDGDCHKKGIKAIDPEELKREFDKWKNCPGHKVSGPTYVKYNYSGEDHYLALYELDGFLRIGHAVLNMGEFKEIKNPNVKTHSDFIKYHGYRHDDNKVYHVVLAKR